MSQVNWLDEGQQRHWRDFLPGAQRLLGALEADLEAGTGLSMSEYEVLVRLSEAAGHSVRMSRLAHEVVASRSRLTHTVRRMEAAGLVERCAAESDGRGVDCVLTPAGMRRLENAAPKHVESVRRHLVDVLSDEQFAQLGAIFRTLSAELDNSQ